MNPLVRPNAPCPRALAVSLALSVGAISADNMPDWFMKANGYWLIANGAMFELAVWASDGMFFVWTELEDRGEWVEA